MLTKATVTLAMLFTVTLSSGSPVLAAGPCGPTLPTCVINPGYTAVPLNAGQVLDQAYVPNPLLIANKQAFHASLVPIVADEFQQANTPPLSSAQSCCPVNVLQLPPYHRDPWYKQLSVLHEPQNKCYTCGPTATRIALYSFLNSAPTQDQLESDEHTQSTDCINTPGGTTNRSVLKGLNDYTNSNIGSDYYMTDAPSDANDLMSYVVGDVVGDPNVSGQGWSGSGSTALVLNVDTTPLDYWQDWNTKIGPAQHYNVAFGYDYRSGGSIWIFDEFDPTHIWPTWTNQPTSPYGPHEEKLALTYSAVSTSPGQGSNSSLFW